jgi:glycosyltransferase involved in cell wall biosynthesis
MSNSPLSVLMPVYNCERYLDEAIWSIRRQTFCEFELVVVNDGSTDRSLEIVREHAACDERIILLDTKNGGIVSALNAGLAVCRGKYIARMDGDDVALPNRFSSQIDFLERHPAIGVVGGWATVIDENGAQTGAIRLPTSSTQINASLVNGEYAMLHPTLMMRLECLVKIGNYDASFRYAEDLDLLLRLGEVTELANLSRTVLSYRRRGASMSDLGASHYPEWDAKALLAARSRGRKISGRSLARAAERISWTALESGDFPEGLRQAWRSMHYAPLTEVGPRALARVGYRWIRDQLRQRPALSRS